jgi:hypothetical protein
LLLGDFGKALVSGACRLILVIGILIDIFRDIYQEGFGIPDLINTGVMTGPIQGSGT